MRASLQTTQGRNHGTTTLTTLVEVPSIADEKAKAGITKCIDCANCMNPDMAKRENRTLIRYPKNMKTSNQRNFKGKSNTVN